MSPPKPTLSSGESASVFSVADDGAGGFYLGGRFDAVGGVARHDLAHVLADGSLDPAFAPDPDGDVTVLARNGSTIYAAGSFTTIGGAARTHVPDTASALTDGTNAPSEGPTFGFQGSSVVAVPASMAAALWRVTASTASNAPPIRRSI